MTRSIASKSLLLLGLLFATLIEGVRSYGNGVLNDHLSGISQTFFAEACPDYGDYATKRQYVT